jgi:16S rRNA (cytosine1402-N4)-methyltransferase
MLRHTILGSESLLKYIYHDSNDKFTVLDCTYGQGLHSKLILQHFPNANVLAFDYDNNNKKYCTGDNIKFIHDNFINAYKHIQKYKIKIDYIMLDLGTHVDQVLDKKYGLSFMAPIVALDMRINNTLNLCSAVEFLNSANKDRLLQIFTYYGNLRNAIKITNQIIEYRNHKKIELVSDLLAALNIQSQHNKSYLAKIFQAIRITINQEIENLITFLHHIDKLFIEKKQNVDLITYTFHSLEDKIVKNFIQKKPLNNFLEDLFKNMNFRYDKNINIKYDIVSSKKTVYTGDKNRRKDLFFITRCGKMISL